MTKATALGPVTNGAAEAISVGDPYIVAVKLEGTSSLLFHRWSVEGIAEKAAAAKGSATKKTDDVETYVWRDEKGRIGLPAEYVRQAMIHAAKFRHDPRSPRKSAMDLYKAAIVCQTELAPITRVVGGVAKTWDFLDQRRVQVQRSGVTRTRPAFLAGWHVEMEFAVQIPEYVGLADFRDVLVQAGRLVGVGDFRPSYGRFQVARCEKVVLS